MATMAMRSEKVRLDQKTVGFSALYEVTKILGDRIDLPQGLAAILRILNSFMGMAKGAICLYDQKRRESASRRHSASPTRSGAAAAIGSEKGSPER